MHKLAKIAQNCRHVQESISIIEEAFNRYSPDNTCISFNGGKDCTAVLYLVHSIVKKRSCNNNNEPKLTAFYAQLPNHFDEESKFVQDTVKRYNLNLVQYTNSSLKDSLCSLKRDAPSLEAIFIGTRRDDFRSGTHMIAMQPTDAGWPQFMRVNPILNWTYTQVWDFIRELDIPYCDLYNQGYSSLGTQINTTQNSSLLRYNDQGEPYYLPAWQLTSSHEERLSRSSSMDTQVAANAAPSSSTSDKQTADNKR